MEAGSSKTMASVGDSSEFPLTKTDPCHVCKVLVPRIYLEAHVRSQKHITCLNITKEAIKRATEGLTFRSYDSVNVEVDDDAYFCEPCVSVVKKEQEILHETSTAHKKSLFNDDALEKLSKIYIDRSFLDNIHPSILDTSNINIITSNYVDRKRDEHITEMYALNTKEMTGVLKHDEEPLNQLCSTEEKTQNEVSNDTQDESEEENLEGSFINELIAQRKSNNSRVLCNVCNIKLPIGSMKHHEKGIKHRWFLKEQKKGIVNHDIHYQMKQTENPLVVSCKVCKIEVQSDKRDVDEHLTSTEHIIAYKNMLIDNRLEKVKRRGKKIICHACNIHVPKKFEFHHIDSSKHQLMLKVHNAKANEEDKYEDLAEILAKDDMKNKAYKYYEVESNNLKQNHVENSESVKENSNQAITFETFEGEKFNTFQSEMFLLRKGKMTQCIVCSIFKPTQFISSHLESMGHDSQYISLLQINRLVEVDYGYFCEICNVTVSELEIINHISKASHYELIFEQITRSKMNTIKLILNKPNANRYFCNACDIYLPNKPDDIKHHEQRKNHAISVIKKTKVEENLHVDFERKGDNKIYCKVCKKNVHDSVPKKHLSNPQHFGRRFQIFYVNNITQSDQFKLKTCNICEVNVHDHEIYNHIEKDSHKKELQKLTDVENEMKRQYMNQQKNKLYCKICNDGDRLYDLPMIVYDHMRSEEHKKKHQLLWSKNGMRVVDQNLYCELCNVYINDFLDLVHIDSDEHKGCA